MAQISPSGPLPSRHRPFRLPPVAATLILLAVVLAACSPARLIEAGRVLADVAAGPGPSSLKERTPAPQRTEILYEVAGRSRLGDLYRPAGDRPADGEEGAARLVLVPGAAEGGKDDPRFVAFAGTLARAGFTVLAPDVRSMRALQVSATNARDIADAVLWLSRWRPRALPEEAGEPASEPVGIVAISYAVGPTVLAALDPEAGPRTRFVLGVGGYYDIEAAVTFFTTGFYRVSPDAPWRHRTPNVYGKWVFVLGNAARLADESDAALLRALADRKLANPAADVADLAARLGPEGRAVNALLENSDPERVPALIAGLPEGIRAEMEALDLKRRDLSRLGAVLHLLHGRDDAIIPHTESEALAGAAPQAELYLVDGLAHVDLGPTGVGDTLTLLGLAYDLLSLRDRMLADRQGAPSTPR